MPTIAEIQAGHYCEGCKADCRHFADEADCCVFATFLGRLAVQCGTSDASEVVEYESTLSQSVVISVNGGLILEKFCMDR